LNAGDANRGEGTARIGARVLSLLAVPLNGAILQALSGGSIRLVELRRRAGSPPQTTLRGRLRALSDIGALAGGREEAFPGAAGYELTPAGRDLLRVAQILQGWLWSSPNGALPLVSDAAKAAVKALVEGWSTSMLRVFATGSFSLTQMDSIISGLNYPSLERRLIAMRLAGQVEATPSRGRGTPYAATEWLRRATAPLAAAMWWEHRYLQEEAPAATDRDIETLFLLGIPLLRFPKELSGSCRLAVELSRGERGRLAGAMVEIDGGSVTFCRSRIEGYPDAWVIASLGTWLAAMIERRSGQMEIGGDGSLAEGILRQLQHGLSSDPSLLDARSGSSAPNEDDDDTDPWCVPPGTRGNSSHGESREKRGAPMTSAQLTALSCHRSLTGSHLGIYA
jgi:DNA-binding HxlR family transcriptional regulator